LSEEDEELWIEEYLRNRKDKDNENSRWFIARVEILAS
jgi:hypothetical protein